MDRIMLVIIHQLHLLVQIEYKFKMDDCLFTQLIKCINIEELENIFSNLIRFDVDYVLFGITEGVSCLLDLFCFLKILIFDEF